MLNNVTYLDVERIETCRQSVLFKPDSGFLNFDSL